MSSPPDAPDEPLVVTPLDRALICMQEVNSLTIALVAAVHRLAAAILALHKAATGDHR